MLDKIVQTLQAGGVVALHTDTIYGVIASALDKKAVEKLYRVKNRAKDKQSIVLISDPNSVPAYNEMIEFYTELNQSPTSVVVPVSDEPGWITRGGNSVAYRVVKDELLKQVIERVGPVVAPSANPEGSPPARNIKEAEAYFGDSVDLYVDGGEVADNVQPSQIIRINPDGTVEKLR